MKAKGPLLLLVTAVLWGMAFVAQTSAASDVGPFTFNASRNIVGAVFLAAVIEGRKRTGSDERQGDDGTGYSRRTLVISGIVCGVVLCASSYLQQMGITSYPEGVAVSGRSGFITALYMVMVAVLAQFTGKRQHLAVWLAVLVALAGMYLLCVPNGFDGIYLGDWLTLASALGYAVHIIAIDRFPQVDGVRMSQLQLVTAAAISVVGAIIFEHPSPAALLAAAVPILYAGVCSDGIAYTLQIIAQKTTDPTVASVIMSLESVFAALGGWIVLSESLTPVELSGCALVFAAVMLAQVPDIAKAMGARKR